MSAARHAMRLVLSAAAAAAVIYYLVHRKVKQRDAAAEPAAAVVADVEPPACGVVMCMTGGAEVKIERAKSKAASSPCIQIVLPTSSTSWRIEYSVHKPSRLLRADITLVFRPDLEAAHKADARGAPAGVAFDEFIAAHLLAIPTWQPSEHDLSEISAPVNLERRGLLSNFDRWAAVLRPALAPHWSDCSCPMEGTARYGTPTSAIYNELEGLTTLLRYDSIPIGCCGIVLHPQWHRRAYPVTLFTLAPLETLQSAFAHAESTWSEGQTDARRDHESLSYTSAGGCV